jgi:rhodanese-related sulfurtransferase
MRETAADIAQSHITMEQAMSAVEEQRGDTTQTVRPVSPAELREMLTDGRELALLDLREELIFSKSHILAARSLPCSRLEMRIARLVPRRTTRIVLCDDSDGLAERAAAVLRRAGYDNLYGLAGGLRAWEQAGFELFSGINVPSKAFGEFIEHSAETPNISASELDALIRAGTKLVVLDSRPFDEYVRMSIPTAINVPGAELVLRVHDIAPSPDTLVVVNCAGRTRSIIGAQSLINAGVPNKVMALRNGTMGWNLAGLTCDTGQQRHAPQPSTQGLAWARSAAERVAQRFGVTRIDRATLERFRADGERTLHVFDVRGPAEYAAGHVAGALSAPGGQLVQATDQYVGTLGARIVLIDEAEVRAVMTGSWLRQMGFEDVFVLAETGTETGLPEAPVVGAVERPELAIDAAGLADLIGRDAATIVDLSLSRNYRKSHIAGAWFAIRSRLEPALARISPRGTLVLTSEDGVLAGLAAAEASALTDAPTRWLKGGNAAWQSAGHPLVAGDEHMADEPVDAWLRPYERNVDQTQAMNEYLAWEIDLLPRVTRDGTSAFV